MEQGARLFQPRSTRALKFFTDMATNHISVTGMFYYATPQSLSRQAIGMMYKMESANTEGKLVYRYYVKNTKLCADLRFNC